MEALGRISVRCYSGSGCGGASKNIGAPPPCSVVFPRAASRRRSASLVLGASGGEYFREKGHLDYYSGAVKKISCGKGDCNKVAKKMEKESKEKKKMDKKRLKKMMMAQKLNNVPQITQAVKREAQAALIEYLHSTRSLLFTDAEKVEAERIGGAE